MKGSDPPRSPQVPCIGTGSLCKGGVSGRVQWGRAPAAVSALPSEDGLVHGTLDLSQSGCGLATLPIIPGAILPFLSSWDALILPAFSAC